MIFPALIILSGIPYGIFIHKYCIDNFFAKMFMHLFPMIFIFVIDKMWDIDLYNPYLMYMCLLSIATRLFCEYKKVKRWTPKGDNYPVDK